MEYPKNSILKPLLLTSYRWSSVFILVFKQKMKSQGFEFGTFTSPWLQLVKTLQNSVISSKAQKTDHLALFLGSLDFVILSLKIPLAAVVVQLAFELLSKVVRNASNFLFSSFYSLIYYTEFIWETIFSSTLLFRGCIRWTQKLNFGASGRKFKQSLLGTFMADKSLS